MFTEFKCLHHNFPIIFQVPETCFLSSTESSWSVLSWYNIGEIIWYARTTIFHEHAMTWKHFPITSSLRGMDSFTKGKWCGVLKLSLFVSLIKLLSKQSSFQWIGMPWRSCDVTVMHIDEHIETRSTTGDFMVLQLSLLNGKGNSLHMGNLSHIYENQNGAEKFSAKFIRFEGVQLWKIVSSLQ